MAQTSGRIYFFSRKSFKSFGKKLQTLIFQGLLSEFGQLVQFLHNVLIFYCSREKSYCISHSLAPNQLSKTLYQPSHDIILKTLQNSNMLLHAHNSTNLVSSSLFKSFILTMFLLGLLIFYSDVSFNFGYSNLLRKDTSIFMIISLFGPMPYSHRTSTAEHHK